MIPLTRIRTDDAVHPNFKGPKRVQSNLKLLHKFIANELNSDSKEKWDSTIWKEAKAQLLTESNNKCAYCETPTRVVAYGDVEHFRPKSIYWWLAYSYDNYLVSCTACNQEYKKDFFEIHPGSTRMKAPRVTKSMKESTLQEIAKQMTVDPVNDSEGMSLHDFIELSSSEYALLVNPYFEDPTEYFAYKPILETNEVIVVPSKKKYTDVIKASENLFGINRKELLDLRFQWYCIYMTFRHTLADVNIKKTTKIMSENRIKEMTNDNSQYAGMVRYFETIDLKYLPWDFGIEI